MATPCPDFDDEELFPPEEYEIIEVFSGVGAEQPESICSGFPTDTNEFEMVDYLECTDFPTDTNEYEILEFDADPGQCGPCCTCCPGLGTPDLEADITNCGCTDNAIFLIWNNPGLTPNTWAGVSATKICHNLFIKIEVWCVNNVWKMEFFCGDETGFTSYGVINASSVDCDPLFLEFVIPSSAPCCPGGVTISVSLA